MHLIRGATCSIQLESFLYNTLIRYRSIITRILLIVKSTIRRLYYLVKFVDNWGKMFLVDAGV